MSSQLQPADRAIFGMLPVDVEHDEIARRLRMSPAELDTRRGIMLRALAPASHTASESYAPLGNERPRRHTRYKVA